MQAGTAAGARTAAGLQPAAASHGAFSHSKHHTPSRLKSQYARDADSGVLVLERQHSRLVQPSAESRLLNSCDQQQQVLWSPDEHTKLLQSQLQPAQRIHQELLHLQQQHVGVPSQQRSSTVTGSIDKEAQDSIRVYRGQLVAALAAAPVDDAGKQAADIRGTHESDSSRTAARLWKGRRPASAPSQSTAPAPPAVSAVAASPTENNSSRSVASSNGATSSEELGGPLQQQLLQSTTAGSSDPGTAASAGLNNESSIASVLQQLQQKLGQQFSPKSKPKAAAAAADHVQKPGKQQLQPPPQPIQQAFPSDQLQRRKPQSPSRTLRKTPQSAVDLVTNGTEFVKFGAGKLRALYPDRRHAGSSLQRLQKTTAIPLVDLVRVIDTAKAPEAVRLRLIHDWRNSPRMPADLQALQQQLVTFGQIADLLGGPETAKEILSSDSTYMVMQLEQLRQQLLHLQQLVSSPLLIVPSVVDRGTSAAAAAASVTTGSSSLAAIKQRLASRQQQQQQQQGAAALPLAAFLQSPSSRKSEGAYISTGGDPSSIISKSDGLGGSSSSSSSGSSTSTSSSSGSSNSTSGSKQPTLHADVLAIVRCQPGILWLRPDDLRARLAALQQALGAKYITDVLQLLCIQPLLLEANARDLDAKITALATGLQLPPHEVQHVICKQPRLLNLTAKKLEQKLSDLKEVLGLPPKAISRLVCAKPSVLLFKTKSMKTRHAKLQALAGTSSYWSAELKQRLGPGSLVQLLTAGEKRLMRAEYLVHLKAQHKQGMLYTVQVETDRSFSQKFPGFELWYGQRKAQDSVKKA